MNSADVIAELEASALSDECRQSLIALIRRQQEYQTGLLVQLVELSGSYRQALTLLDAAEYSTRAPAGHDGAYRIACELVQAGYNSPPSIEALRKRVKRTLLSVQDD